MDNDKPYTLIGSPRTGSTLIYFILRWYLLKKFDYCDAHLGEYFNPYHYNLLYRDVYINGDRSYKENIPGGMKDDIRRNNPGFEIINDYTFKAAPYKITFLLSEQNTIKRQYNYNDLEMIDEGMETRLRISLLEASRGTKYFFKNHANPIPDIAFAYLLNNYNFVLVDRKDKFNQILSFAIANHTRIWMKRKSAELSTIEENSITYTREMFDQIITRIKDFYIKKKQIKEENQKNIIYEDIEQLTCKFELLDLLGFTDWCNYLNPDEYQDRLPVKQSTGDSLKYFKNKNEIIDWFTENSDYFVDL